MSENLYLSGNFAPVEKEIEAFDLPVKGAIPPQLDGRLLRIGPNPIAADPDSYHWFLGNGMVHGLRLRDGRAEWYRNRYVQDDELNEVRGDPAVPGVRSPTQLGTGIANTNVIGHAGRTFAIVEAGSPPVELSDELETIGRTNFDGTLPGSFSAHPKRDPDTDELHVAAYSPLWDYVQYVVVGTDGRVRKTVDVPVPGKPMIHDCAITENYFIVLDLPVLFVPEAIEQGISLPYVWKPEYGARVGLLPREGSVEQIVWAELEPCFVFHPLNAYEDASGQVVLDVVRHPAMFASDFNGPNEGPPSLDRWTIDPKSGELREQRLDDRPQEFPRVDERVVGKPHRYGYGVGLGAGFSSPNLLKHDLERGETQVRSEGEARQFLEPVFVPSSPDADEDDGFVLAYVYDASNNSSDVVILNAQDFTGDPVATIQLPQRVPFGFHGNWVSA